MKKIAYFLAGAFAMLAVIGIIFGAYTTGKSQTTSPANQIRSPLATTTHVNPLSSPISPSLNRALIEQILNSRTYSTLTSYLTNPTVITIYATECCGPLPPEKVLDQLDYVKNASTWTVDRQDPRALDLVTQQPNIFAGSLIALADNDMLVAFKLNASGTQITELLLATSYKLFLNQ
ncbi:hypothetical protein A3A66_04000 [Microgenomates group bacterium RIFCSPLOWO2_01_FULL_46_13]|nr:MAG: hypothetical protein A2783_05560 [Microgenomates group bacterium RIFCSPHIGHO2_01_FULL_45_11]OGV94950.1 MAG: hypothetical protein A3A66_04000 [Microgenomates group bacterium RIFCSPLOWO2_01_FULL_46_13]